MRCSHARECFSDHLDGLSVPGLKGMWMKVHLAICPRCRRFYRSLEATHDALIALKDAPAPKPPD